MIWSNKRKMIPRALSLIPKKIQKNWLLVILTMIKISTWIYQKRSIGQKSQSQTSWRFRKTKFKCFKVSLKKLKANQKTLNPILTRMRRLKSHFRSTHYRPLNRIQKICQIQSPTSSCKILSSGSLTPTRFFWTSTVRSKTHSWMRGFSCWRSQNSKNSKTGMKSQARFLANRRSLS